jgi:hypothetical protein
MRDVTVNSFGAIVPTRHRSPFGRGLSKIFSKPSCEKSSPMVELGYSDNPTPNAQPGDEVLRATRKA